MFWPARPVSRHVWHLGEVRAVGISLREDTWTQDEPGLCAIALNASITRRTFGIDLSHVFAMSDHALARRMQREAHCDIAQALRDAVDALPWAGACFEQQQPEPGSQVPIIVPSPTGHWRGYLRSVPSLNGEDVDPLPTLRTWLPDEAVEDTGFLRALAELRRADPNDLSEPEQSALQLALGRLAR